MEHSNSAEGSTKQESFKLYFGKDGTSDIRRVTLRSEKFEDVVQQLYKLYSKDSLYHRELRVQYEDEEGDRITVSTQHEWEEMWSTVGSKRPIKIFIAEGPNPSVYFKDGPAPEVQLAYIKTEEKPIENKEEETKEEIVVVESGKNDDVDRIVASVPECLQKLFPGGKILPYHLPEWLRDSGAITVKRIVNSPDEVELDICVEALIRALDGEALRNIGSEKSTEDLEKAKIFLETLLAIQPGNQRALYNLACTESLLNNSGPAVEHLAKAVGAGYTDLDLMERDTDLNNIRSSEGYGLIVRELRTLLGDVSTDNQPVPTEVINYNAEQEKFEEVEQISQQSVEEVKAEENKEVKAEEKKVEEKVEEKKEVQVEEKVEEKQKEEEKVPIKREKKHVETRFVEQLKTLEGMGYDSSLCAFLLEEYRGDITKVLEYLFEHSQ